MFCQSNNVLGNLSRPGKRRHFIFLGDAMETTDVLDLIANATSAPSLACKVNEETKDKRVKHAAAAVVQKQEVKGAGHGQ